jgi:hypothetical protein
MWKQKVGIFEDEDLEACTQYYPASVAHLDGCVVAGVFFTAADGWATEIGSLYGSQHKFLRNYHLWEYPVIVPGILSKKEVCSILPFSSHLFDCNRNAEGLLEHYSIAVLPFQKIGPGGFTWITELCPRWDPHLCPQPGVSHRHRLFFFETPDGRDPFAEKPGRIEFTQIAGSAALSF